MTTSIRSSVVSSLEELDAEFSTMDCDPDLADTAAFCAHYGIPENRSANAIVLASRRPEGIHAMFVVLATTRLDVNRMARDLMGVKKVSFASPDVTAAVTGMVMGGVTPFGRPSDLPVFIDSAVTALDWVVVGGGSRDMKVKVDPEVFERMPNCSVIDELARPIEP